MAELAMGIIGLTGAAELCIKGGKALAKASQDYRHADAKLDELCARIEVCWLRTSSQLEVAQALEATMTEDQRNIQQQILRILYSKLETAIMALSQIDKHFKNGKQKRLYFVALKDKLEEAVGELESWHKRFEPSWFELIKTAPPTVAGALQRITVSAPKEAAEPSRDALKFRRAFEPIRMQSSVLIARKVLEGLEISALPHSMVHVARDPEDGKCHIVDTVSTEAVTMQDAKALANRLRESNPGTFGTMRCKGIIRYPESSAMAFVFRIPDGYDAVRSLRHLLTGEVPESLTIRLEIARQLVNAVYYIHLYEFVHKNICPETILCLGSTKDSNVAGGLMCCLIGFQVLRHIDGRTNTGKLGDKFDLYQHPTRRGSDKSPFVMQHDIYSLGVCLLEVGLWKSLLQFDQGTCSPEQLQQQMVSLSRGKLRAEMGDKYSKVVETCLTCLDSDNVDFGDPEDFTDGEGVEVGSRYVEKVISIISTISL
ncbi:hypothetical protein B0I35DRAFT_427435 [Stachybotrys elegans]|uniref:Protein kinase domain-containing protein n=1 Tax=Stachybotrys elegans TaxID=80388 RepID=A0A8K0WS91_9HYPO|nr:hypothetical protein B0I35DRAFT_427435 [Stachybotrys elegans]